MSPRFADHHANFLVWCDPSARRKVWLVRDRIEKSGPTARKRKAKARRRPGWAGSTRCETLRTDRFLTGGPHLQTRAGALVSGYPLHAFFVWPTPRPSGRGLCSPRALGAAAHDRENKLALSIRPVKPLLGWLLGRAAGRRAAGALVGQLWIRRPAAGQAWRPGRPGQAGGCGCRAQAGLLGVPWSGVPWSGAGHPGSCTDGGKNPPIPRSRTPN